MLKSDIAFSGPSTNNGKATQDVRAFERVFLYRQEFDGLTPFAQGLLVSPQERIGQTEGSESWGVIRMRANAFFLLPRAARNAARAVAGSPLMRATKPAKKERLSSIEAFVPALKDRYCHRLAKARSSLDKVAFKQAQPEIRFPMGLVRVIGETLLP